MFIQKYTYFITVFILIFSGCTLTNTNKTPIPQVEVKQEIKEPVVVEKVVKEPVKIKPPKIKKKKIPIYKFCHKHTSIMSHASKYIQDEFKKGYFIQEDIIGAKAQLFLIESNSKSIFSENINNAIKSYDKQYNLAKKNKCNLKKFKTPPLEIVKKEIKTLEKQIKEKENKK
ncbi:hypothetical protein KO488_12350 [Poseidonibacter lekithochrous]|uniref:hypothetical protein n=1 Tax=Poseidonibacter TaxID=2321187 RepID=UPI001C095980|nr:MULTISPECIES: hypothetical protein [Poseidonibacter]MBU3015551.1 hypothetical protein [Poseidonibacter lekithochrous]MDO6828850.1 hypothetical protein [Poseidonibacter sp. 1_MG-2023]